jgi:hypothetical protein
MHSQRALATAIISAGVVGLARPETFLPSNSNGTWDFLISDASVRQSKLPDALEIS